MAWSSSYAAVGRALELLEMEPTPTQRLLAAADHCLTAPYQGQCPKIDPKELLFMRASWRAKVTGRSLAAYAGTAVRCRDWFAGGDLKEMLKGASPEHIERFMAMHRDQGREVYGNPYRGYAGAYLA